jgi:hypothetical protein
MGAWGPEILQDDVAADVYADFMERFEEGMSLVEIRSELEVEYAEYLDDEDDMPVFWLAIARAQWECGGLQADVLAAVKHIIDSGTGLERWEEAGEAALQERREVLKEFAALLDEPNPRPRVKGMGSDSIV